MLTGEYVVLDGALSLALPTKLGQSMKVELIDKPNIVWKSLDEKGRIWFEGKFSTEALAHRFVYDVANKKYSNPIENILYNILFKANQMNDGFINPYLTFGQGFRVTTTLDFPKNWGLGSSSTLINNIAQWANVDAFDLLEKTFGGSGYDIACAKHSSPITYQLSKEDRIVREVNFNPSFKDHLYFVYLNKKQNSREAIAHYKSKKTNLSQEISEINGITLNIISCKTFSEFEQLITQHEGIISNIIQQQPIKVRMFQDFKGSIKSLGAWGGDFVLVTSLENPSNYFKMKGYETVIGYSDLIK